MRYQSQVRIQCYPSQTSGTKLTGLTSRAQKRGCLEKPRWSQGETSAQMHGSISTLHRQRLNLPSRHPPEFPEISQAIGSLAHKRLGGARESFYFLRSQSTSLMAVYACTRACTLRAGHGDKDGSCFAWTLWTRGIVKQETNE